MPLDACQGRRLERLEQAQAKIVLRFMKDSRATISSVDDMINKSSLLPARDSWHGRGSITQPPAIAREKVACPLYSLSSSWLGPTPQPQPTSLYDGIITIFHLVPVKLVVSSLAFLLSPPYIYKHFVELS